MRKLILIFIFILTPNLAFAQINQRQVLASWLNDLENFYDSIVLNFDELHRAYEKGNMDVFIKLKWRGTEQEYEKLKPIFDKTLNYTEKDFSGEYLEAFIALGNAQMMILSMMDTISSSQTYQQTITLKNGSVVYGLKLYLNEARAILENPEYTTNNDGLIQKEIRTQKLAINDNEAVYILQKVSWAAEYYYMDNKKYPSVLEDISISKGPGYSPYLYPDVNFCGRRKSGFKFTCEFSTSGYKITAIPLKEGYSGSKTYTVSTGREWNPIPDLLK